MGTVTFVSIDCKAFCCLSVIRDMIRWNDVKHLRTNSARANVQRLFEQNCFFDVTFVENIYINTV